MGRMLSVLLDRGREVLAVFLAGLLTTTLRQVSESRIDMRTVDRVSTDTETCHSSLRLQAPKDVPLPRCGITSYTVTLIAAV